jgi:hypothetical protein
MKNQLFSALGLAVCFLLSGCVVDSENPLSPPEAAQIDQRLLGDWVASNGDNVHFSAKDAHWMQVVTQSKVDDSKRPSKIDRAPETYDFYVTTIGDQTYLNVKMVDKDHKDGMPVTYLFYRYKIASDGTLHFWPMGQDEMADFVRTGKIKGTVHQDAHPMMSGNPPKPDVDVHLTDSSENLVKFIVRHGADAFGDETEPLTRVRTKD